jgi:hypothetical protein
MADDVLEWHGTQLSRNTRRGTAVEIGVMRRTQHVSILLDRLTEEYGFQKPPIRDISTGT